MFASIDDNIYSLEEVERISKVSNNFDDVVEVKVKKKYIPPMSHPWKRESFIKYLENSKKLETYIDYV